MNPVWTSLMRKHWGIWWTRPHIQAGDQQDSGPTRPAPSLASVLITSNHTHSAAFFLRSHTLSCASSPDLRGKHLSFLGNGDPAVPDWSVSNSLRHFPAFPASTDCLDQRLLRRRQSAHSQGPLRQRWEFFNTSHQPQRSGNDGFYIDNRWDWPVEGALSYPRRRSRRWRSGHLHPRHCSLRWYDEQKSYRSQFAQDSQSGKICQHSIIIIQINYTDTCGAD